MVEYLNTSDFRKKVCGLEDDFEIVITSNGIPKFVALSVSNQKKINELIDEVEQDLDIEKGKNKKDFESINISTFRKELCHLDSKKYYCVKNNNKPCIYIYPFEEKEKLSEGLALLKLLSFSKKDFKEGKVYTGEEVRNMLKNKCYSI